MISKFKKIFYPFQQSCNVCCLVAKWRCIYRIGLWQHSLQANLGECWPVLGRFWCSYWGGGLAKDRGFFLPPPQRPPGPILHWINVIHTAYDWLSVLMRLFGMTDDSDMLTPSPWLLTPWPWPLTPVTLTFQVFQAWDVDLLWTFSTVTVPSRLSICIMFVEACFNAI